MQVLIMESNQTLFSHLPILLAFELGGVVLFCSQLNLLDA